MKYPVLYIYRQTKDRGSELRHSIRSLTNLKGWDGTIYLVGDREKWMNNMHLIPHPGHVSNSYVDQELAMIAALNDPKMPDQFIYMMDDVYIREPTRLQYLHQGMLNGFKHGYHYYQKHQTCKWLQEHGYSYLDYELHVPMLFDKAQRREVSDIVMSTGRPAELKPRSLYGNMFKVGGKTYVDMKTRTLNLPKGRIVSTHFFIRELEQVFPHPSYFEAKT